MWHSKPCYIVLITFTAKEKDILEGLIAKGDTLTSKQVVSCETKQYHSLNYFNDRVEYIILFNLGRNYDNHSCKLKNTIKFSNINA